jgi:hypothetical protein
MGLVHLIEHIDVSALKPSTQDLGFYSFDTAIDREGHGFAEGGDVLLAAGLNQEPHFIGRFESVVAVDFNH